MSRIFFNGAGARLSAVSAGQVGKPVMVIVHGMRDHALSFVEMIQAFEADYFIVAPDLRGHGHSDKGVEYNLLHFVADLKATFNEFGIESAILVGHSLGGHIASRFTATFPEHVSKLVLLDGMGPPDHGMDLRAANLRNREATEALLTKPNPRRQISNQADAVQRLRSNNPKLSIGLAEKIVSEGTEPHPDGGIRWRWESAVNQIWHTFTHEESELLLQTILCPVLIVTGEHSLDYWSAMRSHLNDQTVYEAELERRKALFKEATHEVIADAGHMLHYDQPDSLIALIREFVTV